MSNNKSAKPTVTIISTGYLFNVVANDWQKGLNMLLADYDLDSLKFALLNALQVHEKKNIVATQVMLSNYAGIDKMTTSKLMRAMETQKLLKRKESKLDTRAKSIALTDKGKKLHETGLKVLQKFEKSFFANLYKTDANIQTKLESLLVTK